jgi:hypothetical protein
MLLEQAECKRGLKLYVKKRRVTLVNHYNYSDKVPVLLMCYVSTQTLTHTAQLHSHSGERESMQQCLSVSLYSLQMSSTHAHAHNCGYSYC